MEEGMMLKVFLWVGLGGRSSLLMNVSRTDWLDERTLWTLAELLVGSLAGFIRNGFNPYVKR
jgi:hypothetical protein